MKKRTVLTLATLLTFIFTSCWLKDACFHMQFQGVWDQHSEMFSNNLSTKFLHV